MGNYNLDRKRFYNIDFFKIFFTILIICVHTIAWTPNNTFYKTIKNFNRDFIVVEFFFLIAGFFLYLYKDKCVSIFEFIKDKWIRFAPLIVFQVFILDFIYWRKKTDIITSLFLLEGVGLQHNFYVHWFVSALFWSLIIYKLLSMKLNKQGMVIATIVIAYLSYLIIFTNYNRGLDIHCKTLGFCFNGGFLRALAGVGLGYLTGIISTNLKQYYFKFEKLIFTLFEAGTVYLIINRLCFVKKYSHLTDLNMVFIFAFLILLMYLQRGVISKLLNIELIKYLSCYVYATYIMQRVAINVMNDLYKHFNIAQDNIYTYVGIVLACIILGVITHHLIEKPAIKFFKNQIFVKTSRGGG